VLKDWLLQFAAGCEDVSPDAPQRLELLNKTEIVIPVKEIQRFTELTWSGHR
jgi:hypothetical protein